MTLTNPNMVAGPGMASTSTWRRERQIYSVTKGHSWWVSHAQLPTAHIIDDARWRIFLTGRGADNRSAIVSVDVDPRDDMRVLSVAADPLIPLGPAGAFDCDGTGITSCIGSDDDALCYYSGLRRESGGKYSVAVGLLKLTDGGRTARRLSENPVLRPDHIDPYFCAVPHVLMIGGRYHAWYASALEWRHGAGPYPEPRYHIRHAISDDGVSWIKDGTPCLHLTSDEEGGLFRPWVVRNGDFFEMWYCYRGRYDRQNPRLRHYRIGYTTSPDARTWRRRDNAHRFVNPPEPGDWDDTMQCYPCIVQSGSRTFMFYCGNSYGQFGFGYATRQDDAP